ncbi:hypothetical protein DTO271G3_5996 [Paecilomyces variotii]|nr:hypothetical protein DTO271G3_5996 [Paecilomyces variotii]
MTSKKLNGHGSLYKEVRFSPSTTPIPIRRTRSVPAGNQSSRAPDVDLYNQFQIYVDQARALLDKQRASFDRERETFEEERKLWDRERELLKARIAELESAIQGRPDRLHNVSATASFTSSVKWKQVSFASSQAPHVELSRDYHVWEGSIPSPKPTRVFAEESKKPDQLGPIEGNGIGAAPSLDAALSPLSRAADASAGPSVPVPIEKLDSTLDGITLKSTGLPPNVVAKVMTPPSASPSGGSGSDDTGADTQRASPERRKSLILKLSELGPPDVNLKRDAGHTPMVLLKTDPETPDETTYEITDENPLEPVTTLQPAECSDSYFPDVKDVTDDPALKGPLSLQNNESKDNSFLEELDQKLLDEARKLFSNRPSISEEDDDVDPQAGQGEPEPELKLRSTTTNFGTAFGAF